MICGAFVSAEDSDKEQVKGYIHLKFFVAERSHGRDRKGTVTF